MDRLRGIHAQSISKRIQKRTEINLVALYVAVIPMHIRNPNFSSSRSKFAAIHRTKTPPKPNNGRTWANDHVASIPYGSAIFG
jgi:hypothetical protein